ncbi:restriction endonuclease [Massilia sp. 9I]|uniref:restriction endonuclease n=1 Tax=Massilia sp. 9I TaxID=2653152 RepID=UPI00135CB197|nr:restriction endonuclease [Massilia sp. 9I]
MEVIVGDMVMDTAAGKQRDVDVTVTVEVEPGKLEGYLAYEVKHEKGPIDVVTVEGLCAKLGDMPQLTSRAIVSTSGFTEGARKKATARGVELYTLEPWKEPVETFFGEGCSLRGLPSEAVQIQRQILLIWETHYTYTQAVGGPEKFSTPDELPLFTAKGKLHKKYKTFGEFRQSIFMRSTNVLFGLPPASAHLSAPKHGTDLLQTPPWPMTHTIETERDQIFLRFEGGLCPIASITITGTMAWREYPSNSQQFVMKNVADGTPFAAAIVMGGYPSSVQWAIVMAPGSAKMNIIKIELAERHINAIRGLKLDIL